MLNVTSDKGIFDITKKEITIPLSEYTDLIAKEAMLSQIRHAVSKESGDYGTIGIVKAILQIDDPEDKKQAHRYCSTDEPKTKDYKSPSHTSALQHGKREKANGFEK